MDGLHDADFVAWAERQAALLRSTRPNSLDWERLAEEIDDLGDLKRDQLYSSLVRILDHLLKLTYSTDPQPRRGWRASVIDHRDRVRRATNRSGTLRRELPDAIQEAWATARKIVIEADAIESPRIPVELPFTIDQILADAWWPPDSSI